MARRGLVSAAGPGCCSECRRAQRIAGGSALAAALPPALRGECWPSGVRFNLGNSRKTYQEAPCLPPGCPGSLWFR
eukprot:7202080-Pyramimonas_sp.AAC.1